MKPRTNKHHRKPRSHGGTNAPENISHVNERKHEAYHLLFATKENTCMTPQEIAHELTKTWIDPEFALLSLPKNKLMKVLRYIEKI